VATLRELARHTDKAITVVEQLVQMKREGAHIANSYPELEVMIPYFRDPSSFRIVTQSHRAHEHRHLYSALTMLQLQANGDVTICTAQKPVGNIKKVRIRQIWENRPHWWESDCCAERRLTQSEKKAPKLPILT